MIDPEIIKKAKLLEVVARKRADNLLSGDFKSRFKGTGVQFSEHRVYVPGDDARRIDWRVSARSRDILVKRYEEEREQSVFFVVDVSGSMRIGSKNPDRASMALEIMGMLSLAALRAGDRVGGAYYSDRIEHRIKPGKNRSQWHRLMVSLLEHQSGLLNKSSGAGFSTDHDAMAEQVSHLLKHQSIVFWISDFLEWESSPYFKALAYKHELICVQIRDPYEEKLPPEGYFLLEDPETGEMSWINTGSSAFKNWFQQNGKKSEIENLKDGHELLPIFVGGDSVSPLIKFLKSRR